MRGSRRNDMTQEKRVDAERVSDREFLIGECRLHLNEENILYITIVGGLDEEKAIQIKKAVSKLKDISGRKWHTITDINKAGRITSEARKIFTDMSENGNSDKIAIFGGHPVARVLAAFVMGVSKKKDMRFFKSKEEALAWLKEK